MKDDTFNFGQYVFDSLTDDNSVGETYYVDITLGYILGNDPKSIIDLLNGLLNHVLVETREKPYSKLEIGKLLKKVFINILSHYR